MSDERRHEERLCHPHLSAAVTPIEWTYPEGLSNVARSLLDVSTGGARMIVNRSLEEGDSIYVRLDGLRSKRSLNIPAEVRWVAPLPSIDDATSAYVTGVQFHRTPGILDLLLKV
ncbi:MAG: PilZ domain-containing protein [Planctomycetes bacterium]|nr:PilZ domain-containing protein [Planctomycetota bacterium]